MASLNWVENRLREVGSLNKKYKLVDEGEATNTIKAVRRCLIDEISSKERLLLSLEKDISEEDNKYVENLLLSFLICNEAEVRVVWISDNIGIDIKYKDFAANLNEIWYPSSDDIWVVSTLYQQEMLWVISIDHEEVISLWFTDEKPPHDKQDMR